MARRGAPGVPDAATDRRVRRLEAVRPHDRQEDAVTLLRVRGALVAATAALAVTACGSDDAGSSGTTAPATSSPAVEDASAGPAPGQSFGEGCGAVPADGEGSFAGMADDPVVTAAGNNPALSSLVEAVTAANLVDTFNSAEDVTLLAPANPAFEAVPADALAALMGNSARLTAVLTHHVIDGRLAPEQLAGEHTTLNGDTVTIEGTGETFTVAAEQTVAGEAAARVVCGDVQTANATVYIVDQVLAPPAA
jgi:uncharacterized surface protein with fasciclin (FAS1) repeats